MSIEKTLIEFGRQFDLPNFSLNEEGYAQLQFQSGVTLAFEYLDQELLIYLGQPLATDSGRLKIKILQAANFRKGTIYPLQIALRNKDLTEILLIVIRIPQQDITVPTLSHAVNYLFSWFSQVSNS